MNGTKQDQRDYGLLHAPHGEGAAPLEDPTAGMNLNEKQIFDYLLKPDDSYTDTGVYWADLPILQRIRFVTAYDAKETRRELGSIWAMMKKDPLSPVTYYFRNMVLPGAGLGLEGYVLFSIGNLTSLFDVVWKSCWDKYQICNKTWVQSITYLEVIGIICGQIYVGIVGDWLGRRFGLIQDALVMFVGLIMLTAAWGTTLNGWVICYAWSLFFYSFGVGGEYPMTATSGMENAVGSGKISTKEDRLHRGRKVTSAFLMQGWGQFFNQALLCLLLLIFHHGSGNPPYSEVAAQWTYRISFAVPAVGTLWLVYYRTYKMKSASRQLQVAKNKNKVTGYDVTSLKLTLTYFGPRVIATAFGWFANDVFFYGNKLFQSQFLDVISPENKSIFPNWLWNLVNVGVELAGYYLASFLIDNKLYGRKWMQIVGFLMCFIMFIVPGFHYSYYTQSEHIHAFQAMYYLSSFFNQFGPNAVTFLVAAEVFPTPIRATAHGFSAACGKLGALLAAILYNYITVQQRFYVVPWFGLAGVFTTLLFLPDTTGLDLKEQERRWAFIRAGRESEYHGVAVHPKHLSWWERFRGVGKQYNAEIDYKQRVAEMRAEWEAVMESRAAEKQSALDQPDEDEGLFHDDVSTYFQRTTKSPLLLGKEKGEKDATEPNLEI